MGLISKNKKLFINILRFLNNKPGFRRVFYWIHEIRCTPFKHSNFIATLIDNSFMIGVRNIDNCPPWKRMALGEFELPETNVIKEFIKNIDCFIDIGGHIGYYSCLVTSKNKNIEILTFEPSQNNLDSLMENIKINNFTNIKVYNIALSNTVGEENIYGHDALSSINKNSFYGEPEIQGVVKTDLLDNYINVVKDYSRIFLKIDVESKEYDLLLGAQNFIKKCKPIGMIIEICDIWSGGINPNFKSTFDLIHGMGYKSYLVNENGKIESTQEIDKLNGANYLFIRNDLINEIKENTKLHFA